MAIHLTPLKLDYLKSITDDTGIFQHAKFCIPKRTEGYTTDDNARALIACVKYHALKRDPKMKALASIYLAFLNHMQRPDGHFHNYLSYERTYLDVDASEDCIGRALWSCGCTVNSSLPKDMKMVAKDIFDRGLPWVWKTTSLRFYAFAIMGISQYLRSIPNDNLKLSIGKIADNLIQNYQDIAKEDWHWFEHSLTYDNARLPQALFVAYRVVGNKKYLDIAKESMDFLVETQMVDGVFIPIGNDGWYKRGGNRPYYDQQPLEAAAMVDAAVDGYIATREKHYIDLANKVFGWYMGKNSRKLMVYNAETGGCFDGLSADKINMNQGAESSISYLLARLNIEELRRGYWKKLR